MIKLETKSEAAAFCLTLETKNLDNIFLLLEASKAIENYRPLDEEDIWLRAKRDYFLVHSWPEVYMETVETTATGAYESYSLCARTYLDYDVNNQKFGVVISRDGLNAMQDDKVEVFTRVRKGLTFDEAVEIGANLHSDLQVEADKK